MNEPSTQPLIRIKTLEAGQWVDLIHHVADVHDGKVLIAYDLDGYFDTAEIEEFGKREGKRWRAREAQKRRAERLRRKSACNPNHKD